MKKFILIALIILTLLAFVSCNAQIFDTTYHFDRAIIFLPNGEQIEGKVESWANYANSDMTQVKIDGKTYLTHSSNVILISE
jgi:hypothetical protein